VSAACKEAGTTEQTCYRWRREYGGLNVVQAKRLKQLEDENGRLKKLVADLSLSKSKCSRILRRENCKPRAVPAGVSLRSSRLPDNPAGLSLQDSRHAPRAIAAVF
jgi:hypothetical protein